MLKWIIFAFVLVAEAKIHPGIFYFPTEEVSITGNIFYLS